MIKKEVQYRFLSRVYLNAPKESDTALLYHKYR